MIKAADAKGNETHGKSLAIVAYVIEWGKTTSIRVLLFLRKFSIAAWVPLDYGVLVTRFSLKIDCLLILAMVN